MKFKLNKELVKKRFHRTRFQYEKAAIIQTKMAQTLLKQISTHQRSTYYHALEIGTGSGLLTHMLAKELNITHLFANDIIDECHPSLDPLVKKGWLSYIPGDAEKLELHNTSLDLIISNATVQWFDAPLATLSKWIDWLKPHGLLAFTTFGPDNFLTLKKTIGLGLEYPASQRIIDALLPKSECLCFDETIQSLHFPLFVKLLQHLKSTGVNALKSVHWTKSDFNNYATLYQKQDQPNQPYTLTYHPYCFLFKKRGIN